MTNIATSVNQQTLLDILYIELGSDSDLLEKKVHQMNPHLALLPENLPEGTSVVLPEMATLEVLPVQEFWD